MIYYDGGNLYTNTFGAFSLASGTIIGDVSRRSPSYESRITKYMEEKGLSLLLCNTSARELVQRASSRFGDGTSVHVPIVQGLVLKVNIKGAKLLLNSNATRGFEGVIRVVCRREMSSDYFLYSIDWSDAEGHNVRMATLGQMDQLVWQCAKDGIATFPLPQGDRMENLRRRKSCSLNQIRMLWPNMEFVHLRRAVGGLEFMFTSARLNVMIEEVQQAMLKVEQARASGAAKIEWITENPGQQWSGTFRPMVTALTWYNTDYCKPLRIGIPHPVYSLLRCAQKRHQSALSCINRDILKLILHWVCNLMVADVERVLFGQ
jgi:hypothetical protein